MMDRAPNSIDPSAPVHLRPAVQIFNMYYVPKCQLGSEQIPHGACGET